MTRADVLRLALEAGFTWEPINNIADPLKAIQDLLAYHSDIAVDPRVSGAAAGLVEQAKAEEREACAKVCESRQTPGTGSVAILQGAADAILARGQK